MEESENEDESVAYTDAMRVEIVIADGELGADPAGESVHESCVVRRDSLRLPCFRRRLKSARPLLAWKRGLQ
jgi:hypothetical protein